MDETKQGKKVIKINFFGFSKHLDYNDNIIISILKKRYDVVICDDPDYYFVCSTYMNNFIYYRNGIMNSFCKFPQVRIFVEGENLVPDFNLVDYAICSYNIDFYDRNMYVPCGVEAFYSTGFSALLSLKRGTRHFTKEDLEKKIYFANFIANHESENNIRGNFFKQLSKYKRIESPGHLYNNTDINVSWRDGSKEIFQRKSKFSLCFESTKQKNFITEKIIDAFKADTIPIYYGSEDITDIFNSKAFINCNDFENFDQVIDAIIEIDGNDDKYIEMQRQPIFVDDDFPVKLIDKIEKFLFNIFDQPPEKAYRRSRVYSPEYYEKFILESEVIKKKKVDRILKRRKIKGKFINLVKFFIPNRLLEKRHKKHSDTDNK